jgi:choline monooxygenase
MQSTRDAILASTQGNNGLPNEVYTSADYFQWERRNVIAPMWFAIAFGSDVPAVGDIRKVDALGMSAVVVRDETGAVRVFHNVCRHRGRQLVDEECGHAKLIRCPYHAWTYRLDGRLNGTPHIGGAGIHNVDGFDKKSHGLFEIRSHLWMDMVFVNLSGSAERFEDFIAPLEQRLSRLWGANGPHAWVPATDGRMEMEVRSNWKLAVENYLEAYHLPIVHPGLNSYSPLSDHYSYHENANFAGQGVTTYRPNIAGVNPMPPLPDWPEELKHTAEYPALYPNALIGVQSDHIFSMILIPTTQATTVERVQIQYLAEAANDTAYLNTRHSILETWRLVFQEDVSAVEGMQIGRSCDAFDGGVFTPVLDQATHHFHRWYAGRVGATAYE